MAQVKAICKAVTVQSGGYPEIDPDRKKVVTGSDRCVKVTFDPAGPPSRDEKKKSALAAGPLEVYFFEPNAESNFQLDKTYVLTITEDKE